MVQIWNDGDKVTASGLNDMIQFQKSLIGNFNTISQGGSLVTPEVNQEGGAYTKSVSQDNTKNYAGIGWDISDAYKEIVNETKSFCIYGNFRSSVDINDFFFSVSIYDVNGTLIKSIPSINFNLIANNQKYLSSKLDVPYYDSAETVVLAAITRGTQAVGTEIDASNYCFLTESEINYNKDNLLNDFNMFAQANTVLSFDWDDNGKRWAHLKGGNDSNTYNGVNANITKYINSYRNSGVNYLSFKAKMKSSLDKQFQVHIAAWDVNGKSVFDDLISNFYVKAGDVIPITATADISKYDLNNAQSVLFSLVTPSTVDSSFEMQVTDYELIADVNPVKLTDLLRFTTSQGLPYYCINELNNLIVQNATTDTTKAWHGYYFDIRSIIKYLFNKKIPYFSLKMEVSATQDSTYLIQTNYQNSVDHVLRPVKTVNFVGGVTQVIDINVPVSDPTNFPNTIQLVFTTPNNSIANNVVSINLSSINIGYDTGGASVVQSNTNRLPEIRVSGDVSKMSKTSKVPLSFSFTNNGITKTMYAKVNWQGDSSLAWPKKNYRIALYNDAALTDSNKVRFFADFPKNDKFNLKANYTDASHTRNIVNADLFSQITALRPDVNPVTASADNFSQIKGKPINVYINGTYNGLYSLNTYNNNTLFNFDKTNPNHFAVEASKASDATLFKSDTALLDGTDFELKYPDDVTDDIKAKLNRLLAFANSSTDSDFLAHESEYININSFIDYILFNALIMNDDGLGKNAIYQTFDGNIWYALPYDLDSTWRMYWTGTSLIDINTNFLMPNQNRNKLFTRVITANKTALKNRWTYLRSNVLRADHVIKAFEDYYNSVGQENYKMDQDLWPNIPSIDLTSFNQLKGDIYTRLNVSDKQVNDL